MHSRNIPSFISPSHSISAFSAISTEDGTAHNDPLSRLFSTFVFGSKPNWLFGEQSAEDWKDIEWNDMASNIKAWIRLKMSFRFFAIEWCDIVSDIITFPTNKSFHSAQLYGIVFNVFVDQLFPHSLVKMAKAKTVSIRSGSLRIYINGSHINGILINE